MGVLKRKALLGPLILGNYHMPHVGVVVALRSPLKQPLTVGLGTQLFGSELGIRSSKAALHELIEGAENSCLLLPYGVMSRIRAVCSYCSPGKLDIKVVALALRVDKQEPCSNVDGSERVSKQATLEKHAALDMWEFPEMRGSELIQDPNRRALRLVLL